MKSKEEFEESSAISEIVERLIASPKLPEVIKALQVYWEEQQAVNAEVGKWENSGLLLNLSPYCQRHLKILLEEADRELAIFSEKRYDAKEKLSFLFLIIRRIYVSNSFETTSSRGLMIRGNSKLEDALRTSIDIKDIINKLYDFYEVIEVGKKHFKNIDWTTEMCIFFAENYSSELYSKVIKEMEEQKK